MTTAPEDSSGLLIRYGFYVSILLFFYGTLFPFQFDFSPQHLAQAWSSTGFVPFWDFVRGRVHSLPDSIANILLTVPLGFFGFLHRSTGGRASRLWKWCALGLTFGFAAESLQLAIPLRNSDVADAVNNGLGALAGAAIAHVAGNRLLALLTGAAFGRESAYLSILITMAALLLLGPFDFSLDVPHFMHDLRSLQHDPWEIGLPVGDGWIQSAVFVLIGALSARMSSTRRSIDYWSWLKTACAVTVLLPVTLEVAQFLVESHAPSARDLALSTLGAVAGFLAGLAAPAIARPVAGLVLISLALIASGMSPFQFVSCAERLPFEWVPLVEYYQQTTSSAMYDAIAGLVGYGLIAGLLQLSWPRCRLWFCVAYAVALSSGIEFAQMFLPLRSAGVTDILIAGIGAWAGALIVRTVESSTAAVPRSR